MSPLWTKSWSLKLTLGGQQLGRDGSPPSLPLDWRPESGLNPSLLVSILTLLDDEQYEKLFTCYYLSRRPEKLFSNLFGG